MAYFLEWSEKFLLVFFSLFAIVDPFAIIPTFLALTKDHNQAQVDKIITRACLFAAEILVFFQLFGSLVFHVLGIKLDAFKVAGGVLLFLSALDMLQAKQISSRYSNEMEGAEEKEDISIVPLAIPLLSGPGAITSVIVFSNDVRSSFAERTSISILAISAVFLITYVVLIYSKHIKKLLGNSGITVMQRVMGILLAAISLQMMVEGLSSLVQNFLKG